MSVFKTIFRIIKKIYKSLIIPLIILILLSQSSLFTANSEIQSQEIIVPTVGVRNYDNSGEVTKSLISFLEENTDLIYLDNEDETELLFYKNIYMYIKIPENYSQDFIENSINLKTQINNESPLSYMIEQELNDFLNSYSSLLKLELNSSEINKILSETYTSKSIVSILDNEIKHVNPTYIFSTQQLYPVLLTISTIVVTILICFNQERIKERITISSMSNKRYNIYLLMGVIVVSNIVWLIIQLIGIILMKDYFLESNYWLLLLNSYVFLYVCVAISFLLSKFVSDNSSKTVLVNSSSLGLSFISGMFVPLSLLSDKVISLAKLFPLYWNNIGVEYIQTKQYGDFQTTIFVQILFIIAIMLLALIVSRKKAN